MADQLFERTDQFDLGSVLVRVRILGGVSVMSAAGVIEPIAAPRPRLLLALLASRHGTTVDDDVLAEAIWGDIRTPTERTALQTHVSVLRDLLEPERPRRSPGTFIRRDATGYSLVSESVDVHSFEQAVERARAVHADDPGRAVDLLEEALALWADPPFGEFADEPWARGVVTRLRNVHTATLESRFGLALDEGTEGDLIERMELAVRAHPYRERLVGQLMLTHHRAGHQQRALELYVATRTALLDDLGLDPGRELQLLERAILTQDPALRRRSQATVQPIRPPPSPVPAPATMIGRDGDRTTVLRLLESERCVTIVGPGGVGKTSLAESVVAEYTERFGVTLHHVDLTDLGGRDVLRGVAGAVRVVEHPLAPLADSIVDALGDEPTLLVVETCEVDIVEAADAIASLLRAPALTVLATSQAPLQIREECVHRLGPLTPDEAIALLTRHRSRHDDRDALAAIAERVERLPLGLELASSRLDQLGARELLRELECSDAILVGRRGRPDRQRSARAAAEWSVGLLDGELRTLLVRLAAFSTPFTLAAAEHAGDPVASLGPLVGELVDRSLVVRLGDRPGRFRIPDTVRAVAAEVDPELLDAARGSLANSVLAAARRRMVGGSDDGADLDDLTGEVVPALDRYAVLGDDRQVALAGLLGTFFVESGRISEGLEQLRRALDHHPDANEIVRVLTSAQLGFLAWYQGDLRGTLDVLAEIDGALARVPMPDFVDTVKGCIAFVERRYDDAAALLERAADARSASSKQKLLVTNMAGNACWYAGRIPEAAARYRSQRELARERGDQFQLAQGLRFEAMVTVQLGDVESAWRWAERSLTMAREMSDSVSLAQSSAASAVVAHAAGDMETSAMHAVAALDASRRHFDVFALRTVVPIVGELAHRRGDDAAAARLFGWFIDLLEQTGQAASPATADLAAATIDEVRAVLGRAAFAREAAKGAAMRVVGVIDDARAGGRVTSSVIPG
jgi:predicted ATPase/DNA-binding SARP family transcriptional activator